MAGCQASYFILLLLGAGDPSTLGPFSKGTLVVILLIVAASAVILIRTRQKIRAAQRRSGPQVRELYDRIGEEQSRRRDLDETILQLDQLARQVGAMIDTKYAKLEAVIRDADQRIAQLSKLTGASLTSGAATLDVTVGNADLTGESGPGEDGAGTPEVKDDHRTVIYRLADEGKSALTIAQALDQPTGEVELILALRRTRQQTQPSPLSSA